jgi:hypothetical protein
MKKEYTRMDATKRGPKDLYQVKDRYRKLPSATKVACISILKVQIVRFVACMQTYTGLGSRSLL